MINYFSLCVAIFTSFIFTMTRPSDGSNLNYLHVLFEWQQIEGASSYQFELSEDASFSSIIHSSSSSSLIEIVTDNISWNSSYYWRVRPVEMDGSTGSWVDEYSFSTTTSISNPSMTLHEPELYQDGVTFLGSLDGNFSAAYDKMGNEIWNTAGNSLIMYNTNFMGELYGAQYNSSAEHVYPAKEFNLDVEYLWEEPNDEFSHHDMIRLPDGNYMSIVETTMLLPVPQGGPWYDYCYSLMGPYCDNNVFPWVGDKIVIWDRDSKEVLWEWDAFDYYSTEDYDGAYYSDGIYGGSWDLAFNLNRYDWTHANAITYSENESAIYLSCRHLSRITKIHFNTDNYNDSNNGDIIWNIGQSMPSGDVDCGDDLQFSWQHSVNVLENGNIVTLDNGNLSNDFNGGDALSRAIEINPNFNGSSCDAQIVWEYVLPAELFGHASGGVQKLDNGNYLISTVGGNGTTLEVSSNMSYPETVWEAEYNLSLGLIHRAYRVSGLYPIAASATLNGYSTINNSAGVYVPTDDGEIKFSIFNDGTMDENFIYTLSSVSGDWYSAQGSLIVEANSSYEVSVFGSIDDGDQYNDVTLTIHSENNLNEVKSYTFRAHANSDLSNNNKTPENFSVILAYPNPFNPSVNIDVNLDKFLAYATVEVFDLKGNLVDQLYSGSLDSGKNLFLWAPQDLSAGKYIVSVQSDYVNLNQSVIYIK